ATAGSLSLASARHQRITARPRGESCGAHGGLRDWELAAGLPAASECMEARKGDPACQNATERGRLRVVAHHGIAAGWSSRAAADRIRNQLLRLRQIIRVFERLFLQPLEAVELSRRCA